VADDFWKEVQKQPDMAYWLMRQSDDCWLVDVEPKGHGFAGPFTFFVPLQDRTVTVYAVAAKLIECQNNMIELFRNSERLDEVWRKLEAMSYKMADDISAHLSSKSIEERQGWAAFLATEVLPCLRKDPREESKQNSMSALHRMVLELRPPATHEEKKGLRNASFYWLLQNRPKSATP
jgi:hypothetical protein